MIGSIESQGSYQFPAMQKNGGLRRTLIVDVLQPCVSYISTVNGFLNKKLLTIHI